MAARRPEALPTLRAEWLVDAGRRGAGADVGQLMLMLLGKEAELLLSCWICNQGFEDCRALRRHELAGHLSQCTRCSGRHSGKCPTEPLSGQTY